MKEINAQDLHNWIEEEKEFQLIDVREPYEHNAFNIGGSLIPMGDLMSRVKELKTDIPVVLYCQKGIRSVIAIQRLEAIGYTNLYNLTGGMKAWQSTKW